MFSSTTKPDKWPSSALFHSEEKYNGIVYFKDSDSSEKNILSQQSDSSDDDSNQNELKAILPAQKIPSEDAWLIRQFNNLAILELQKELYEFIKLGDELELTYEKSSRATECYKQTQHTHDACLVISQRKIMALIQSQRFKDILKKMEEARNMSAICHSLFSKLKNPSDNDIYVTNRVYLEYCDRYETEFKKRINDLQDLISTFKAHLTLLEKHLPNTWELVSIRPQPTPPRDRQPEDRDKIAPNKTSINSFLKKIFVQKKSCLFFNSEAYKLPEHIKLHWDALLNEHPPKIPLKKSSVNIPFRDDYHIRHLCKIFWRTEENETILAFYKLIKADKNPDQVTWEDYKQIAATIKSLHKDYKARNIGTYGIELCKEIFANAIRQYQQSKQESSLSNIPNQLRT